MESFAGFTLILAGTLWFAWSLYSLWKGEKSKNWNTTKGTITKSIISESFRKGRGTCPVIHYEYFMNGRRLTSDRINWGNVHLSGAKSASKEVTDRYKKGKEVKVYFNPNNVAESVLEPGPAQGAILSLIVSCVPIIAGIIQLKTGFLEIG